MSSGLISDLASAGACRVLVARDAGDVLLTPAERDRQAAFGSPVRRALFALGRTAARALLAERLGVDPLAVPLAVADDGAPVVEGHAVHVSLSHTVGPGGPLALAAVADARLGVDVEALKPRRPDLYRFLLHADEYDLLGAAAARYDEPPEVAVVRLWAMKEAALKALRTGFRLSPKKLRLTLTNPGASGNATPGVAYADVVDGPDAGTRWCLHLADVDGCASAIALPDGGA